MSDKVRQKKEKILLQARIVHTPEYRYRYLLLVGTVCVGKKFLLTPPFLKIRSHMEFMSQLELVSHFLTFVIVSSLSGTYVRLALYTISPFSASAML